MNKTKRMLAILLSLVMMLSMTIAMSMTAFAADPAQKPAGALTVDDHISVKDLQAGDTVSFYKVLEWNDGWKAVAPFNTLTDAEVEQILGKPADDSTTPPTPAVPSKITAALAEKIAKLATGDAKYTATASASGEAKVENPESGLYVATIVPAKTGYMYNPVFVGADYSRDSATNEWTVDESLSYSDEAMAKKTSIPLTKTASTAEEILEMDNYEPGTVAVGETVTFTVNTMIPEFADDYTTPVFKVTDAMSTGLELDTSSIKVYAANSADESKKLTAGTQYKLNPAATTAGFTVDFDTDYIKGLTTNQEITIQYKAKVTSDAPKSVNEEDNTVTVNFSNNPSDTTGLGILKDKTNHYTFDIDGNLWGEQPYKVTEVVKVGVDKNGNEITETVTLDNGKSVGALQGAEFKLYTNEACTNEYPTTGTKYVSPIVTDGQGRMTIKGLDAGTYWIKETKAPDGYMRDQNAHRIDIEATIEDVNVTEYYDTKQKKYVDKANDDTIEVKYSVPTLKSYKVKIDGVETASYSIQTDATSTKITDVTKGDTVVGTDANKGKIKNTPGTELPSTGGIGTVIFYTLGTILVIGCGIVLISRRRLQKNK